MVKEELEKKAEVHIKKNMVKCIQEQIEYFEFAKYSYIAGAKENSVIWHDLKKNPDDLPKRYKHANRSPLVITNKGIGHYNFIKKTWYIYNAECNCSFFDTVIAWCELPKFEVEE